MDSDAEFKRNVLEADSIPALVTAILETAVTPHALPRRHRPHRSCGS
jgi:hypothetical protein